jgi:hypothetical protein
VRPGRRPSRHGSGQVHGAGGPILSASVASRPLLPGVVPPGRPSRSGQGHGAGGQRNMAHKARLTRSQQALGRVSRPLSDSATRVTAIQRRGPRRRRRPPPRPGTGPPGIWPTLATVWPLRRRRSRVRAGFRVSCADHDAGPGSKAVCRPGVGISDDDAGSSRFRRAQRPH